MNIRDLRYIVAIADLGHFGQAAEQCCVSQPTLSGQVKKLEASLGIAIFERTNRRVLPTDSGLAIINAARSILRDVDTITDIAKSAQDPFAGKFRLGAFPTLAPYIFPQLVPQVKQHMADIRLILLEEKTDDLLVKLKSGEIDAAMLALPLESDFLESEVLFDDTFMLATPSDHVLAKQKEVSQNALAHHPLLLLEEGHCLRDQALDVCQLHNISEEQDFKATSLETLRQMVKAGTGDYFYAQHCDC